MSQPNPTTQIVTKVVKATLRALPNGDPVPVHFNPASLVYTHENSSEKQGRDPKRRQHVGDFTAKLTMDLQFDTTDSGKDVRQFTSSVELFMVSSAKASKQPAKKGANAPAPPVLSFDWGVYHFQGFMESFKETIDFFSADGVPLRALVSIGLARQDNVIDPGSEDVKSDPISLVATSDGDSATEAGARGGDQNAGRALASANGLENPRFTNGATLQVAAGIQLNAAVGFVASASAGAAAGFSAGASAGLGAGFSAGASAGFGFGAGAGISAGASAGIGVSVSAGAGAQFSLVGGGAVFGSTASAGVPLTAGAFAGLETGRATISTTAQLDPTRMLPATVGSNVSTGAGASFALGGVALAPSGFSTDVGAQASFKGQLTFDGE